MKTLIPEDTAPHAHCHIGHDSQDMKATAVPADGGARTDACARSEIPLSLRNSTDGP